jgi:adenylate kinase
MFEDMRVYIERNGRPYNYLPTVNKLNQEREQNLIQEETDRIDQNEKTNTAQLQTKQHEREALEKLQ